ncbi:MAG: hypothetical protein QXL94_04050 [Candidatus Parvarchaeum sp.]
MEIIENNIEKKENNENLDFRIEQICQLGSSIQNIILAANKNLSEKLNKLNHLIALYGVNIADKAKKDLKDSKSIRKSMHYPFGSVYFTSKTKTEVDVDMKALLDYLKSSDIDIIEFALDENILGLKLTIDKQELLSYYKSNPESYKKIPGLTFTESTFESFHMGNATGKFNNSSFKRLFKLDATDIYEDNQD